MSEARGKPTGANAPQSAAYAAILVDSTGHALRIEKILKQHGLANKLIPTPRQLSSDCGVCVRVQQQDVERIRTLLDEQRAGYQAIEPI